MEKTTRNTVLMQCFGIGAWLMLLVVKFLIGFPFSAPIGTMAIFVTAAFVLLANGAIAHWNRRFTFYNPEMTCLKDATENATYIHRLLTVANVVAALVLLAALILMIGGMKTTDFPIKRYMTNWALYALSLTWLGHLGFFVYDLVTLHLWQNMETIE